MDPGVVYAGYSIGAGVAHLLLEMDRQAGGAILLSNANPPSGASYQLPVQVHVSQQDPWVDEAHLRLMTDAGADVHTYEGGHLFTDPDLPGYDARSTALVRERVATFLSQLPRDRRSSEGGSNAAAPIAPAEHGLSRGGDGHLCVERDRAVAAGQSRQNSLPSMSCITMQHSLSSSAGSS